MDADPVDQRPAFPRFETWFAALWTWQAFMAWASGGPEPWSSTATTIIQNVNSIVAPLLALGLVPWAVRCIIRHRRELDAWQEQQPALDLPRPS